jgi:uncharacterized protein YgbK (DUF1537 family)
MIVVLADDLSGAAELAGAALQHGLAAEVQTQFTADTGARVICVDCDTRSRPAAEAASVVGETARAVVAARPEWIYKKCDSVLRGNVVAEMRAALAATGQSRALLLPVNPSRGRVIRGGEYFIHGQPLHLTEFARDPEHPRRSSRVSQLLADELEGVQIPDAASGQDVLRHAEVVAADALPAGGVEFFQALLAVRCGPSALRPMGWGSDETVSPTGPVLLVCGSATAWDRRREPASRQGVPVFTLPCDAGEVARALRSHGRALLGIGRASGASGTKPTALTALLAESVVAVLRQMNVARLLLEGGATAAAAVRALGWTRLRACGPCPPGVGLLERIGGPGPMLLVKPGSYDWPAGVWSGG